MVRGTHSHLPGTKAPTTTKLSALMLLVPAPLSLNAPQPSPSLRCPHLPLAIARLMVAAAGPQVHRSDAAEAMILAVSPTPPAGAALPRAVAALSEYGGVGKERAPVVGEPSSRRTRGLPPVRLDEDADFEEACAHVKRVLREPSLQSSRTYCVVAEQDCNALIAWFKALKSQSRTNANRV